MEERERERPLTKYGRKKQNMSTKATRQDIGERKEPKTKYEREKPKTK